MRRRYLLILVVPAIVLLALGAIPSLLGGGDVHYVTATEVDLEDGEPAHENATETIPAANLSANRFPYALQAIEEGVSDPYEEGPFGIKSSFAHTPFDEFAELEAWERDATADGAVWIASGGEDGDGETTTYYRLEITTEPEETDD